MISIAELDRLFGKISNDAWRRSNPFLSDLGDAQSGLWRGDLSYDRKSEILDRWIQLRQPCFFARFAALHGLLRYTFIDEEEIRKDPVATAKRVRAARRDVGRLLYEGRSMGWNLVVVSKTLAQAVPNVSARHLAARLFNLLIRDNWSPSNGAAKLELDRIWLRDRDNPIRPLCWESPYNFFSAQADGRPWRARRFPAGWAFSLNSVGHSVAAKLLTPEAGLAWAQRTMMRTPGVHVSPDESVYSCDYDTDTLLPAEFFAKTLSRRRGPFAFTELFDGAERSTSAIGWSEDAARRDGRGFRTAVSDLWFL